MSARKLSVELTKTNKNRLRTGTHTLAQVLILQGFMPYPECGLRTRTPADIQYNGVKEDIDTVAVPSITPFIATGVLDPKSGEAVPFSRIRVL